MARLRNACLLFLCACAGPTGYERARTFGNPLYGYSDKRIGDDEFSVAATGNERTSKRRVAQIALLRAAHLTQEAGRTHFIVVRQKTQMMEAAKTDSIVVPLGGIFVPVPALTLPTGEPTSVLIIRTVADSQAVPEDALDAAEVIRDVGDELDQQ